KHKCLMLTFVMGNGMGYLEKLNALIKFKLKEVELLSESVIDLQLFAAEDEGRTEEPTEYKKRKAREEGNVPKSQELAGIIVFLLTFWTMSLLGGFFFQSLLDIMRYYLENFST